MNQTQQFAADILANIDTSPTPFHAVKELSRLLLAAGFERLSEAQHWDIQYNTDHSAAHSGRYFITRNDSSLVAFVIGQHNVLEHGLRLVGTHTDSPCLKLKPLADLSQHDYAQLGVEVYGGAILHTWFDRNLSLAGRVSFVDKDQQVDSVLINDRRALAVIPNLAIHLNRETNKKHHINAQQHLAPIISLNNGSAKNFSVEQYLRQQLKQQHPDLVVGNIIDFEISLYDQQPGCLAGIEQQFISSARLDNLLSCFVGLQSLLQCSGDSSAVLVCNDHEEVGSVSSSGAQGPMLESVLQRLLPDAQHISRALNRSMMISVDNSHAVHPNYAQQHEPMHLPLLNSGPVLKVNSNQRYASNSETQLLFAHCCEQAQCNLQRFVTRSDLGCGSTIGPASSAKLGVATVDVGMPSLAMHSIREMAGVEDVDAMHRALNVFFNLPKLWA